MEGSSGICMPMNVHLFALLRLWRLLQAADPPPPSASADPPSIRPISSVRQTCAQRGGELERASEEAGRQAHVQVEEGRPFHLIIPSLLNCALSAIGNRESFGYILSDLPRSPSFPD